MRNGQDQNSDSPEPLHYIPQWADHRDVTRAQIARDLGVQKSTVTRWFKGTMPRDDHLRILADYLECPEVKSLFRHPNDDWFAREFRRLSEKKKQELKLIIELAQPERVA